MSSTCIIKHLTVGLGLRIVFLLYGLYQDSISVVKYTDIDYSVYSDAANYVVDGKSPYLRETYRYTPILAWILTPNIYLSASYGKLIFILFDLITAYLIYLIVQKEEKTTTTSTTKEEKTTTTSTTKEEKTTTTSTIKTSSRGVQNTNTNNNNWSIKCSWLWIYNPLPIVICTRGSSESIILAIVLAMLYYLHVEAHLLAGLFYGFAVHFKPYTLPFGLPLYLTLGPNLSNSTSMEVSWKSLFTISRSRIKLIIGAILGFSLPTILCYSIYGTEFLEETYFYHITRKDIKHNFSLYFYLLYLSAESASPILKLISFLPQLVLLSAVAFLFPSKNHLSFCLFIQTYCFVIFNKVCTSQYFLWYLSILPIIIPKINMKWTHSAILLFVWYFAQFSWLLPAYYLEFEGRNTYMYIWLESIAFFCANIGILVQVIKSYDKID